MSRKKPRAATPDSSRPGEEERPPGAGEPSRETASDQVHDAGRPGGLPDLEKKTETEEEHDWWGWHG